MGMKDLNLYGVDQSELVEMFDQDSYLIAQMEAALGAQSSDNGWHLVGKNHFVIQYEDIEGRC